MPGLTPNFGFNLPDDGGSDDAWGALLLANWSALDEYLAAFIDRDGDEMDGELGLALGSIGVPGLYFKGDADSGFWSSGPGDWSLSINGVLFGQWNQTLGGYYAPKVFTDEIDLRVGSEVHARIVAWQTDADNGGFDIYTQDGGTLAFRIRVNDDGRLGLGTNDPKQKLDINGAACGNLVDMASGVDFDVRQGNYFKKTITGNTTFTVSGVPTGRVSWFSLRLTNGGAFTVTWPASFKWPLGVPPGLTASGVDVLGFITYDDGATWNGVLAQKTSS